MKKLTCYLVSIPRRVDRRRRFLSQLNADQYVVLSSEIGGAFDYKEMNGVIPDDVCLFPWKQPGSVNPWWARNLKLGEIACALNHLSCWGHAAALYR